MWFREKPIVVKRGKSNRRRKGKRDALLMVTARPRKRRGDGLHKAGVVAMTAVAAAGLIWVLAAGVHWSGKALFSGNDLFTIRHLELTSDGKLQGRHIRQYARVEEGLNLFGVSLDGIKRDLESVPLVRSVRVRRVLPDTLVVDLTERIAIARLGRDDRRFHLAVDRDGHVLGPSSRSPSLPAITGLRDRGLRPGSVVNQPLVDDALEVLDICDTTEIGHVVRIKTIDVRRPEYLDLELSMGERVKLGRDRLDWRLRKLGRALQEASERGEVIATADFTVDKNFPVVFRSAAESARRGSSARS